MEAMAKRQRAETVTVDAEALDPGVWPPEMPTDPDAVAFWSLVDGDPNTVQPAGGDDDDAGLSVKTFSLHQLSDEATGALEATALQSDVSKLDVALLNPDDAFMIDLYSTIYVWIGDGATEQERQGAIVYAEDYLVTCASSHISMFTPVRRLLQSEKWPKKLRKAFGVSAAPQTSAAADA